MSENMLKRCLLALIIVSGFTLSVAVSIDHATSLKWGCKPGSVEALFTSCEGRGRR